MAHLWFLWECLERTIPVVFLMFLNVYLKRLRFFRASFVYILADCLAAGIKAGRAYSSSRHGAVRHFCITLRFCTQVHRGPRDYNGCFSFLHGCLRYIHDYRCFCMLYEFTKIPGLSPNAESNGMQVTLKGMRSFTV